jgi:hypothetical protein
MLIWGSRSESKDLGPVETKACPTCERERPFHLIAQYRLHHIWYLFKWVSQKEYLQLCEVCRRGTAVDKSSPLMAQAKGAIPAFHRYSWAIIPALIGVAAIFGMMESGDRSARNADLIASPRSGDTYVVDLSKLMRDGDSKFRYGLMRINAVQGANIELALPKVTYNKVTAATKDLSDARKGGTDYFSDKSMQVPVADLKQLLDSGAIHSIRR